jgi:hypothetical protein
MFLSVLRYLVCKCASLVSLPSSVHDVILEVKEEGVETIDWRLQTPGALKL